MSPLLNDIKAAPAKQEKKVEDDDDDDDDDDFDLFGDDDDDEEEVCMILITLWSNVLSFVATHLNSVFLVIFVSS